VVFKLIFEDTFSLNPANISSLESQFMVDDHSKLGYVPSDASTSGPSKIISLSEPDTVSLHLQPWSN
jgi:hypothetical protein